LQARLARPLRSRLLPSPAPWRAENPPPTPPFSKGEGQSQKRRTAPRKGSRTSGCYEQHRGKGVEPSRVSYPTTYRTCSSTAYTRTHR
jgi:hypothetical protein